MPDQKLGLQRQGGRGRGDSATVVPRKASEAGACKDLEGHIFSIGSGNKGKNGRYSLHILVPKKAMKLKLPRNRPAEKDCSHRAYLFTSHIGEACSKGQGIELRLKSLMAEKAIEAKMRCLIV